MPQRTWSRNEFAALALAAVISLALAPSARADRFILRSGEELEGRILLEANGLLHLDTDDGLYIITRAQLKKREIKERTPPNPTHAALYSRLRTIRSRYFDRGKASDFEEGRTQIFQIFYPFEDADGIVPLTKVLIEGKVPARDVLTETLARFGDREATLLLTSIALTDAEEQIRRSAAGWLRARMNGEVSHNLRLGLKSQDDRRIRNAAEAAGLVLAREAVPDLIEVLDTGKKIRVRHSVWGASTPASREINRVLEANDLMDSVVLPWRIPGKGG